MIVLQTEVSTPAISAGQTAKRDNPLNKMTT